VWRLGRLSRSLKDLISMVTLLDSKSIGLKSLHESIDTNSSSGKLIFHTFSALAEFEHNLIRERTQVGLKAARARGRLGGRPKALDTWLFTNLTEVREITWEWMIDYNEERDHGSLGMTPAEALKQANVSTFELST